MRKVQSAQENHVVPPTPLSIHVELICCLREAQYSQTQLLLARYLFELETVQMQMKGR